jgi:hypothetical protein
MNLTFTVGIIGSLIGLVAGLAGTYLAIVSSVGPREKSFMVRAALVCWAAVAAVLAARFFVPGPLPVPVWPLLGIICLWPALRWWSDRQVEIREAEQAQRLRSLATERPSRLS